MSYTFVAVGGTGADLARSRFVGGIQPARDCKRARQLRFGRKSSYQNAARMCAKDDSVNEPMEIGTVVDDLKSDDDFVVVDGKDVEVLIAEMQKNGDDALLAFEDQQERLFQLAEEMSNKREGREGRTEDEDTTPGKESATGEVMEYFTDSNVSHMPKWAREAYQKGAHSELEHGSEADAAENGRGRLHTIVEANKYKASRDGLSGTKGSGIFDCNALDVAADYGVPVEFVTDIMISFGVKTPIILENNIQDKLMNEEVESMLHLITSFDAQDLSDRYSDKSIMELADDYDLEVGHFEQVCEEEGIYLANEEHTRLQLSREDRVLDILLHDGARGKSYPSLLEGLIPEGSSKVLDPESQ